MKSLKYRDMRKRLFKHDSLFEENSSGGKGSERMFYHPNINGSPKSYPIKCHGEGMDMKKGSLKAILRHFNLPKDLFD